MEKYLRNFLVLGLIVTCVPMAEAARKSQKQASTAKQQKLNAQLTDAARFGKARKIKQLIARGANANSKDFDSENGRTALVLAVIDGYLDACKALINGGADINAKDASGKTALWHAVSYGEESICKLLVESGADVKIKDSNHRTALDIAIASKNKKIIKLLSAPRFTRFKAKIRNFFKRS